MAHAARLDSLGLEGKWSVEQPAEAGQGEFSDLGLPGVFRSGEPV